LPAHQFFRFCEFFFFAPFATCTATPILAPSQLLHPQVADTPSVPNVAWDDVGGLADAKREIMDLVDLTLRQPDLFADGDGRSGLLLFGPPGTGKTLLAKAMATECGVNFMSVKGPELLNMYIGESERNVRHIFATARASAPVILFFDELDSLAPARGRGSDSAGVMDRVVSQLLAEIDTLHSAAVPPETEGESAASGEYADGAVDEDDGDEEGDDCTRSASDSERAEPGGLYRAFRALEGGKPAGTRLQQQRKPVFVVAATNRPDLLDTAMMRPGRFDRLVYLGISRDAESKRRILAALTRKFHLADGVDLDAVARACPPTATGADLYGVAAGALSAALRRRVAEAEAQAQAEAKADAASPGVPGDPHAAHPQQPQADIRVTHQDLLHAAASLAPSVTEAELRHYEQLRAKFCGRPAAP
jgi:SpoVK/Ycf46/Vps4 family AAA+-type ATPase